MKNLLIAIALLITSTLSAQEFNGVKIEGDLSTFVYNLKAKNYTLRKYIDGGAILDGKVGYDNVEVFVFTTPKSKKVFRVSVYFEKKATWSSLKSNYYNLLDILKNKYGEPDAQRAEFESPYYEGDGYELSAVKLNKIVYGAAWKDKNNLSMTILISEFCQVNITYDNTKNENIRDYEVNNMKNSIL